MVNFVKMDVIWDHFSKLKDLTSKVAKHVLTIPHSNADAERVFSMINKNKMKTRVDLALERTVSSIVTYKVNQFFEERALL